MLIVYFILVDERMHVPFLLILLIFLSVKLIEFIFYYFKISYFLFLQKTLLNCFNNFASISSFFFSLSLHRKKVSFTKKTNLLQKLTFIILTVLIILLFIPSRTLLLNIFLFLRDLKYWGHAIYVSSLGISFLTCKTLFSLKLSVYGIDNNSFSSL